MSLANDLARDGFAGPLPLFSPQQCEAILARTRVETRSIKVWGKDRAAGGWAYYEPAIEPALLAALRQALGNDIILWGASLIVKKGNDIHTFHTDAESAAPDGGFMTVWIGLSNTSRASGLKFVRGSHRFGASVQEANHRRGVERLGSTDETTLAAARSYDPAAEIVQPDVNVGEALLFDGRTWHGSHNAAGTTRVALLLQYARADVPVYLPAHFDWPMQYRTEPRPPVLVVSGRAPDGINNVVEAPKRKAPKPAFVLALQAIVDTGVSLPRRVAGRIKRLLRA